MKSVLQNLKITNTIHKFDKWGCGCDYVRFSYKDSSDFIETYIDLLDTDNSNYSGIEIGGINFTIQKLFCNLGTAFTFSCSYNDVSVPCFQFVKFNENSSYITNSYGKLDIYGSMFRLIDMDFFDKSIFLNIKDLISTEIPKITRYDYRIDFFSNKEMLIPEIEDFLGYIHIQSKTQEFRDGKTLTNRFVGSKNNGRYGIRYYDKLLDTDKKQKMFLYQDYFKYKSVHRLEFEFQRNFLKGYSFFDFYDGLIQEKIDNILGLNYKLYYGPMFYQYEKDYTITEHNKTSYLKKYSSASVRLAKNKINPLIQCYKSIFYELEEEEFQNNINDFLDFIGSDRQQYRLLYERKKQLFLDLHKI